MARTVDPSFNILEKAGTMPRRRQKTLGSIQFGTKLPIDPIVCGRLYDVN